MKEIQELWDWRQRIASIYHDIRSNENAESAWHLWCDTRATMFKTHPQSPIEIADRQGFSGPAMFPYDSSLRLRVSLVPSTSDNIFVDTGSQSELSLKSFARTEGLASRLGNELTLYWIEGYGGGVFLPFKDVTSGIETYGGGRYLLDTIKGADLGSVGSDGDHILDFNFSYFPSCAYSSRYVCPLAPLENRLAAAVRGGERVPIPKR